MDINGNDIYIYNIRLKRIVEFHSFLLHDLAIPLPNIYPQDMKTCPPNTYTHTTKNFIMFTICLFIKLEIIQMSSLDE